MHIMALPAVQNYPALTGVESGMINSLPWILVAAALVGMLQARWLRANRRSIYERIGKSRIEEEAVVQPADVFEAKRAPGGLAG